jgi:hypothetical protein
MPSSLAWLDYSDGERRKVLEVVELFRERDTRDELGLGTVRDALADSLSPGTSTVHTRAKYFLLIPWTYQRIERQGRRAKSADQRAREAEIRLIEVLSNSQDSFGTIGQRAKSGLQRLPSSIYWQGLATWGIRLFPGSREQYHQWIDLGGASRVADAPEPEDPEAGTPQPIGAWHPGLPAAPEKFPEEVSLSLTTEEADYLAERIRVRAPGTLLDFLVTHGNVWDPVAFPWDHPQYADFPPRMREIVDHGERLSLTMHGAALLYNLMLAEAVGSAEWTDRYQDRLEGWVAAVSERRRDIAAWDRARLWEIARSGGARVGAPTERFVESWLRLVLDRGAEVLTGDTDARDLIRARERRLKGAQARLSNRRALELWRGEAGTAALSYRWGITQQHALDILRGRGGPVAST